MSASNPWLEDMAPFRLYGKLWHIGGKSSPSYLFDTEDGLLLLDTGYPKIGYIMFRNIYELGYDPRNIRWVLHSHGHFDHIGMTRAIVEMTGAKTYLGAPDRAYVNGTLDLTWAKELGTRFDEPFEPDVLLHDGDILHFGKLTFRCLAAPGHTPGTMAYFFDLEENGVVRHAAMHGGVGFNSMKMSFLREYGLSADCRMQFLEGLRRLKKEQVDVVVGNHLGTFNVEEKLRRREADPDGPNPFVDPDEWVRFLTSTEEKFLKMLSDDPE